MSNIYRTFFVGLTAIGFLVATDHAAIAQYPVAVTAVQPVVPAVVGYAPERRGLFGRRTVYRPVVAPVAAAIPVTPSVTVARPVTVVRPVVVARPVVAPQVTVGYAPAVAPVRAYYAPPVVAPRVRAYYAPPVVAPRVRAYYAPPVVAPRVRSYYAPVVPVNAYRVPVTTYVPAFGY